MKKTSHPILVFEFAIALCAMLLGVAALALCVVSGVVSVAAIVGVAAVLGFLYGLSVLFAGAFDDIARFVGSGLGRLVRAIRNASKHT